MRSWVVGASVVLIGTAIGHPTYAREYCESLKGLHLSKVEINSATLIPAGMFVTSGPTVPNTKPEPLAAHCIVKATARPTSDSEIGIEVWLPAESWNGRYEQIGNGGWAGAIHASPLAGAVRRGFATASTDDGHTGGITDDGHGARTADFAVGHPEKLIDYGYRALAETRATALALIKAYYGQGVEHSYFFGCSDGGREALMVAQRFPEAFDGILAGDPGNTWSHWSAALVWAEQAQRADSPGAIPVAKRALIQKAVLAQCDDADGVHDGLISDPRLCRFDPAVLTCKSSDASDCLTVAQVATLRKIYEGPRNPRTGAMIHPGYPPGLENNPGSNIITPWRPGSPSFGDTYFGQVVFERNDWDPRTLDFDADISISESKSAPIVDAVNPDLRSFRAHGGKLIQYHGWSDPLMPAGASVAYYEDVEAFMDQYPDPRFTGGAPVTSFYRLFMIPGMGHCYGGTGPTAVVPGDAGATVEPDHDLLLSLQQWVEKGVAPEKIIGTGPAPLAPAETLSRPICPYPQSSHYRGSGNTSDAANFVCAGTLVRQSMDRAAGRPGS